ncbi:MAG TPA: ATPase domain-containing protein [Dehalococcoidia bacterium]|nr:ATPase domain-containing protein [Dehalococcoidia bacterium]
MATAVYEGKRRVISTGSTEIDKKMGGGIPEGSLILIEGQSNAGKSVVTQQLMHGALNGGFRCATYTTENTSRSLFRQMQSLALDITDFFLLGALNVYTMPAAMTPEAATTAFDKMLEHLGRLQGRYDVIFIDSLTSFVSQVPESATLTFLTAVKEYCDQNMTIFFTLHSHAFEEAMFMRMRSLCDAHLKLRVEEMRDTLMKVLEVAKVRGAEKSTGNIISFDVEPGLGMRIIPVSTAKA